MDKKLLTPERIMIAFISILIGGSTVHFGPSNAIDKLEARMLTVEGVAEKRDKEYFDRLDKIERKLDRNLEKFQEKIEDIKDMIKRRK